jgi:hypothetical protein
MDREDHAVALLHKPDDWQSRNAALLEWIRERGPVTVRQVAGWFGSYSAAYKRLQKWAKAGVLNSIGNVYLFRQNGRPEQAYGTRASGCPRHDVLLTEVLIKFPKAQVIRDPGEAPFPDAIMYMQQPYWIELCTGEETHRQLIRKFRAYEKEKIEGWMLFVSLSKRRMENVLRIAPDFALLSTLRRVVKDPLGRVWQDTKGNEYALQ